MQEQPRLELVNEFLKVDFPITSTIPERVSEEAPATVNRVGLGFISAYAAAYFGSWIAILTPVVVTLALRIQQINPAGKDLGVLNIANALPQSIAPAVAPIFLAIGGGGNYTALFIAAAMFALLGALSIQPVKGVR